MPYSQVLFKDKKDLTPTFKSLFPDASFIGAMSKIPHNPQITILSVLFSYVGKKTLAALPNLKYVVARSHGIEKINLELCKERNITVCKVDPFAESTSDYITENIKKYDFEEPYCFYGFGSVNKKALNKLPSSQHFIVNSKTNSKMIEAFLLDSKTIILSVSANKSTKNLFNKEFFSKMRPHTNLISISRSSIIDNRALLDAIKKEIIDFAVVDCLAAELREELLATKKVIWTQHTAWLHNLDQSKYPNKVKEVIDSCLIDKPMNMI